MGAKNRNTARAKQQEQLDAFRTNITVWYLNECRSAVEIRELLLARGLDLTLGQVHYAIHRFELKRSRNTQSEKHLSAIRNRTHPVKSCKQCGDEYTPQSGNQIYCHSCAPSPVFCRRIQRYGIGKKEYDTISSEQSDRCPLCENLLTEDNIAVDHDHASGQIRGLLCRPCNLKLAVVEDSKFVVNAQKYLQCSKTKNYGILKQE